MKYFIKIVFLFSFLFFFKERLSAFDVGNLWRHPEIAGKNSVFVNAGFPLVFRKPEFNVPPLYVCLDYMLPIKAPAAAGLFFYTPAPNFKDFGVRGSYHFDLNEPYLDVYFLYSFNCGFLLKKFLERYNDAPPRTRLFDYRIGLRYFFESALGLSVETGFRLESVSISLSVKLK